MGKQFKIIIKLIIRSIVDVLFPKKTNCILCNEEDVQGICEKCIESIKFCENQNELCVGYYKGALKKLIIKLKCKNDFEAGEVLVELAEKKLINLDKEYYLTYVPTTKRALKKRGFNQCEYIATELAKRNGFKVLNTLKRIRKAKEQKTLDKQERANNMYKVFDVIDKSLINGRKFILIDDIKTTGSTLNEGVRVLAENGASDIKTLTLAKSLI